MIENIKPINMIYVAHPYEGKSANVQHVRHVIKDLTDKFGKSTVFVSALTAIIRPYQGGDAYIDGLMPCLELMSRCDAILMAGDWESSIGCRTEMAVANQLGIMVYMSPDEIVESDKDYNYKSTRKGNIYAHLDKYVHICTGLRYDYEKAMRDSRRHKERK